MENNYLRELPKGAVFVDESRLLGYGISVYKTPEGFVEVVEPVGTWIAYARKEEMPFGKGHIRKLSERQANSFLTAKRDNDLRMLEARL